MLIWLASYPRSGNTLVRTLLKQVFDLDTYSKHEPIGVAGLPREALDRIGAVPYDGDFWAFVDSCQQNPDPIVVKTHDAPETTDAAIYVVRHGIASAVSYQHFASAFEGRQVSWREAVDGFAPFGSWSDHLDAWAPLDRPRTLLIKYEDVLARPDDVAVQLSRHLNLEPRRKWHNEFTELQSLSPSFFRRGMPDASVSAHDEAVFLQRHATWMRRLGYLN